MPPQLSSDARAARRAIGTRLGRLLCGLAGAALALAAAGAHAQGSAAAKTTRIIVPFAPGGSQDVIGRYLATQLAARLQTPVIVENKPGAGGAIAADAVAKAAPDGATLLLATGGAISIAPHLAPKLPYKPAQDFAPIALIADTPMVMAVRTQSPYPTLASLLAAARNDPAAVTFASTGNSTVSHLTGELLAQGTGAKLTHVPYRGAGPALVDLLGGQVASIVTTGASVEPMVESGKVRVLTSFTARPLANLAGVPTVQQAGGGAGLAVPVWVGLMAPARTPPALLERLSSEVVAICRMPQTRQRLAELGAETTCGGAPELARMVAEDTQRWEQVIRRGNIKAD
jgi:tripartite-type tricarboxylate transporter receptor subunit TctC